MHAVDEGGCQKVVEDQKEIVDIVGEAENERLTQCEDDSQEELNKFTSMPCEDPEAIDEGVETEAEEQRGAADPGQPTQAERDAHDISHFPFRPWCKARVRGRAKDAPSRKVKALFAESVLLRVRMDYCFLTEDVDKKAGEHGEDEG